MCNCCDDYKGLISCTQFMNLDALRCFLNSLHVKCLHDMESIRKAGIELGHFYFKGCYIENRFPKKGYYVNLSSGTVASHLRRLCGLLKTGDIEKLQDIFACLDEACSSAFLFDKNNIAENGVFNRETFEKVHLIRWDEDGECYHHVECTHWNK